MARIFTLYVPFEGRECPALVNLNTTGYDMAFSIHFLDRQLHSIVPGGHLEFSLSEGLKQPTQLPNEGAIRLVGNTVDALSNFFATHKQVIE